jgi:hypothetical protein
MSGVLLFANSHLPGPPHTIDAGALRPGLTPFVVILLDDHSSRSSPALANTALFHTGAILTDPHATGTDLDTNLSLGRQCEKDSRTDHGESRCR